MALALGGGGDDLARTVSGRRSFQDMWHLSPDVFSRHERDDENDEEELRWAALERLPTYDRVSLGVLKKVLEDGSVEASKIDVKKLSDDERRHLMNRILKASVLGLIKLAHNKKRKIQILKDGNGIIRPSRITLLLGPPGSGKTTFLLSLAGKLDHSVKQTGKITYCGYEFNEFVPRKTCAYISQHDVLHGEMTVRETLDFSARCLGVGSRYELLAELSRREKKAGIVPDPEIDVIMKAMSISGRKTSMITDYVLKLLGLDICSDIMVGNDMRRGVSGGQKKRVTTGEMLVGPGRVFFMDEISTGLDSSTTFQIVNYMRQIAHINGLTMIISLLQPPPETYNLFDDVILLSEGEIVYQGPKEHVIEFFEYMGFKCPERKGVADFLQEVTSKKDQEQYWYKREQPYRYISASKFAEDFTSFHVGQNLAEKFRVPFDNSTDHGAALVKKKYSLSNWELFRACFSKELLLMKRNSFVYVFKTSQITLMSVIAFTFFFRSKMSHGKLTDGGKFFGALFFSLTTLMFNGMAELTLTVINLPVFYKHRDHLFYPAWAYCLPIWILRIPLSIVESTIWVVITYYTIGFAPSPGRFFRQYVTLIGINQMALGLFRFIAAIGKTQVVANTLGTFTLLTVFVLGGFIIAKNDLKPWLKWAYYVSPMSYAQNAIAMNEFLDKRWSNPNTDPRFDQPTIGKVLLHSRGFYTEDYMFWVCDAAVIGFSVLFNVLFIVALTFSKPLGKSNTMTLDDDQGTSSDKKVTSGGNVGSVDHAPRKGMLLPFSPLSLVFQHTNYYVDMPAEMKSQGVEGDRLQLLRDVSGAFRPEVLTALVGSSGAGKTTLMDVLAGRKTGGYIEGKTSISGYPKNQATFARISGYCEQNDIHSPNVTVYESVLYSAWLRLPADIKKDDRLMFVEQVMELVELNPIRNSLVGLPGVSGLSTEQRKRLTIAVELVANPSIIFMDEPTSGLDARAAAIVMRCVRNTVDTGRTVVCTIHQPSIDIFEAFDELLLMKRGGRVVYAGPLGKHSQTLIDYFEAIPGVPKIEDGYNPATWMLDISTSTAESQLGVDFADIYANSPLYQRNQELIEELSTPPPGSSDLHFSSKYSQSFLEQCRACFWKQYRSYWRNPQYNGIRFFMTIVIGLIFGTIFLKKGRQTGKQQDLQNIMGAIYSAVLFQGASNNMSVQGVVSIERTVFYRERAAGMYSALPYAFAQVAIEMIYISIQSMVYSLLLYSMIGFEWIAIKFFWFYYFFFMSFTYFTLYGMMFISLTPGLQVGSILSSFFLSFWNLFSGFLLPRPHIPIWWRWYYWGSPIAWTIYGLVTSQFGDLSSVTEVPGVGLVIVKDYLKHELGYDHDFLPVVAVMHLLFVLLFGLIFGFGIKMAMAFGGGDDLGRSSRRSFRDVFSRGGGEEDDEELLRWAAIERLPTFERMSKSVLKRVLEDGTVKASEIDVKKIGIDERGQLMAAILNAVEEDNEMVGIDIPKIEIRYEQLGVEGDVHVGGRALPTLINATLNTIESILGVIKLVPSNKKRIHILKDANGIIKPSRITLLLGPPGAGKTTFLLALAGKLDPNLRKSGKITCCGHEFSDFVPQRTCAYISQHDLHHGEMTVRETLDFSSRCLGVGKRYEMLEELSRREKKDGIKPDPEIDAFMKAISFSGQKSSLVTDYALKILGLDICSDIMVGDDMRRGISGGQKKRVTTGEMLVGPANALLMDEISTGLDSSTTFQIIKYMSQIAHIMDETMIISLLQPPPETYNLFDDIILLSEGQIVYQGPRENVLEFFEVMGFKCPERKGVADFLQEVTSKKDQEQYWYKKEQPYTYISATEFAEAFKSFHIGQKLVGELRVPYDKLKAHPSALVKEKYGLSNWELFRACFSREWLLIKRNSFIYTFKTVQITIMAILTFSVFFRTKMPHGHITDGGKYLGALFFSLTNVLFNGTAEIGLTVARLPVFYKQRDFLFYPAWAFALPIWILRIPMSILDSTIWIVLTYYTIGFAPDDLKPWLRWAYYISPMSYGQNAIAINEFLDKRWSTKTSSDGIVGTVDNTPKKGMLLPFQPLSLVFDHINYYVDMPAVVANTLGTFTLLTVFVLGGFIIAKNDLKPWLKWAYYVSPMSYAQNAIAMNEFLDKRWSNPNTDPRFDQPTIGKVLLHSRGFYTEDYMITLLLGPPEHTYIYIYICVCVCVTSLASYSWGAKNRRWAQSSYLDAGYHQPSLFLEAVLVILEESTV
ncbi:hypothetical protein ACS0TY_016317 [Phlomoides rotata]